MFAGNKMALEELYEFARDAVTKSYKPGGLKQDKFIFLWFRRLEV